MLLLVGLSRRSIKEVAEGLERLVRVAVAQMPFHGLKVRAALGRVLPCCHVDFSFVQSSWLLPLVHMFRLTVPVEGGRDQRVVKLRYVLNATCPERSRNRKIPEDVVPRGRFFARRLDRVASALQVQLLGVMPSFFPQKSPHI